MPTKIRSFFRVPTALLLIGLLLAVGSCVVAPGFAHKTSKYEKVYEVWRSGRIERAAELLENEPGLDSGSAGFLRMKIAFVKGDYPEALSLFSEIDEKFSEYKGAVELALDAYLHLGDYESAWQLASRHGLKAAKVLDTLRRSPFRVIADRRYEVPFIEDRKGAVPVKYFPGVAGSVNGIFADIRFDTGGTYIVMGKEAAEAYGIKRELKFRGMHGPRAATAWYGFARRVSFRDGPEFENMPVTIVTGLGDMVVFGTNILEQFLTTVDYPRSRFLFTPRTNLELVASHLDEIAPVLYATPFYLWSDHYMFARGEYGDDRDVTFFFDSGLVAVTSTEDDGEQASAFVSRKTLLQWGYGRKELRGSRGFIRSDKSLAVGPLSQSAPLIYFDKAHKKDFDFGGVRVDALLSHSWLKRYVWTIDFDRQLYLFSEPPAK